MFAEIARGSGAGAGAGAGAASIGRCPDQVKTNALSKSNVETFPDGIATKIDAAQRISEHKLVLLGSCNGINTSSHQRSHPEAVGFRARPTVAYPQ